jgi:hypothetical protein
VNQGLAVPAYGISGPDRRAAEPAFHGWALNVLNAAIHAKNNVLPGIDPDAAEDTAWQVGAHMSG